MALWHCVSGACYHLYSIVFIRPCVCVWFTYIKNYILIWERRKKKHNQNEWEKNKKNTHGQAESNRALFQNVFVLFSKYNSKSRYTFFLCRKKRERIFCLVILKFILLHRIIHTLATSKYSFSLVHLLEILTLNFIWAYDGEYLNFSCVCVICFVQTKQTNKQTTTTTSKKQRPIGVTQYSFEQCVEVVVIIEYLFSI